MDPIYYCYFGGTGGYYECSVLTVDTKPLNPPDGALCYERDGLRRGYIASGGAWVMEPAVSSVASVAGRTGVAVLVKADVGLGSVDNTADAAKPVSTSQQAALDGKQVAGSYATGTGSASGTNTGDNATNTQYSGLAASKQDTLVSGTNIKTINGQAVTGSGDLVVSGAAPAFTAFTKDLGVARSSGTFDITGLSGLTAGKVVLVVQSAAPIAAKGNARDEPEFDQISATGYVVDASTIRSYWQASGVVVGTYAFAYQVSG